MASSSFLDAGLKEFLDAVPARTPAPGGGAVAAIAASLAAGLTAMAARFAPDEWESRAEVVGRAEELRARAEPLADADAEAYGAFMAERTDENVERIIAIPFELAEAVVDAADHPNEFEFTYPIDAPIEAKIEAIATRVYGAAGVVFLQTAKDKIKQFAAGGLGTLPICMAKTHLSLSHDPALTNAPTGFELTVRDIRAYTGAGWLVPLCGDIQQMPGLGKAPAALNVDIDAEGRTVGLF